MKNLIIGVSVIVAGIAIGVGGGYLAAKAMPGAEIQAREPIQRDFQEDDGLPYFRQMQPGGRFDPGKMGRDGRRGSMGPGMFYGPGGGVIEEQVDRISMDDAVSRAEEYAASAGENLRIAEVMEFSRNFYAVVLEEDSGKGAMELLVDPYSGQVAPEIGPNRMWNSKYGHMRLSTDAAAANSLTMEEASAAAQKALDEVVNGAVLSPDGIDFYGYYSFDYLVDGKVAGMLSVHGENGQVWFHNWHGSFISEKEIDE